MWSLLVLTSFLNLQWRAQYYHVMREQALSGSHCVIGFSHTIWVGYNETTIIIRIDSTIEGRPQWLTKACQDKGLR